MSVLPHPTGGYRAYKKINGKEFQFYSFNKAEADKKQEYFNALSSLKSKNVFSGCGRLCGFRVRKDRRPERNGSISMVMQTKLRKKEYKYKSNFELFWKTTKDLWKENYDLTSADMKSYSVQLKTAKRIYIADLSAFET